MNLLLNQFLQQKSVADYEKTYFHQQVQQHIPSPSTESAMDAAKVQTMQQEQKNKTQAEVFPFMLIGAC